MSLPQLVDLLAVRDGDRRGAPIARVARPECGLSANLVCPREDIDGRHVDHRWARRAEMPRKQPVMATWRAQANAGSPFAPL